MTSRPAGPRALRFYQSANLERRGSSGKFETRFHREIGSEQEKKFGRVIYASETIQNCKNPTGDIGTLITFRRVFFKILYSHFDIVRMKDSMTFQKKQNCIQL